MKRSLWVIVCLCCLSATPALAWRITAYHTLMEIQSDSSVLVTENIAADFTGDPHHGIYRDLPLSGQDRYGNNYRLRFELLGVTDQTGIRLRSDSTFQSGRIHILIGDPDVYVSDQRTYVIRYRVLRAVHFFEQYDELYWNAVGMEWQVPIERATCTVTIPKDVPKGALHAVSYSGFYGSTTSDALSSIPNNHSALFRMTRALNPGEAMTVVVGWPKGIVHPPAFKQAALWFISDNGYLFLPPVFLMLLCWLWWSKGRDPETGRSEMVAYDPPDSLRPAELGTLIDERADLRDISATIVDLAMRGYIHIAEQTEKGLLATKTDYLLTLQRPYAEVPSDPSLTGFERVLIGSIFADGEQRLISALANKFYIHLPILRDQLYDGMVKRGYFTHRPDSVRRSYRAVGVVLALVGAGLAFASFTGFAWPFLVPLGWSIAIALCGVMLAVAARTMPRKTRKGKNALLAARGFEEYLSRAERQEIELQERQGFFEKFLPYAMVLGIADRWARAFEGIQTEPPKWYSGYYGGVYRPVLLTDELNLAASSWGRTLSSTPRSQGGGAFGGGSGFSGGFSGGGFGGGGGGAW